VHLLNKYNKIIRKTRSENDKLENKNESLLAKLKSSDELREQNEIMTTKLKELKLSLKELKDKHDKLESVHDELITRHRALKEEFTTLKANNDNLELAYDLAISETHVDTNHVAKLDVATSCDDLLVENISNVLVAKARMW
jgi:predicted nuclease with TOPRIM domain